MEAAALAKLLCRDVVHSVGRRNERSFIVTRFRYPDGDFVPLYVEPLTGDVVVSDLGTTLFKCTVRQIAMTDQRHDFIISVCKRYGVQFEHGLLRKKIRPDAAGVDCLAFCEAITRISKIQMETDTKDRSDVPTLVDRLMEVEVKPRRPFVRRWNHPVFDAAGDYPVDYRLNTVGEARHIFYVGSQGKSTLVVATSNFLKLNGAYAPTLAIIDPEVHFGRHYISRLQRATTQIRYGIRGYENDIVKFALSGMDDRPVN